jgi:hypothetical protein
MPVQRLALDGPHTGVALWALVNRMPSAASRDRFGVFACGCPPMPSTESFRSSQMMNRTLGFSAAETITDVAAVSSKAISDFKRVRFIVSYFRSCGSPVVAAGQDFCANLHFSPRQSAFSNYQPPAPVGYRLPVRPASRWARCTRHSRGASHFPSAVPSEWSCWDRDSPGCSRCCRTNL